MAYTLAIVVLGLAAVMAHPQTKGYYAPVKSVAPAPTYVPAPTMIDACTCESEGNVYSTSYSNHCGSFSQRTAYLPAESQNCPLGTVFNVATCTCAHPEDTVCAGQCAPEHYHKSIDYKSHDYCVKDGNTYQQMPGTHCSAFLQSSAELTPVKFHCPAGLQFSLDLCVCDYPENVHFYGYGHGHGYAY